MSLQTHGAEAILARLSPREREVLERTARGMTNAEVAADLLVTTHAVKFHLAAVYRKLGVANRTQAAAVYLGGTHGEHVDVLPGIAL